MLPTDEAHQLRAWAAVYLGVAYVETDSRTRWVFRSAAAELIRLAVQLESSGSAAT